MTLSLVTSPSTTPLTVAQMKDHLQIVSSSTLFDADVTAYLRAATDYCERITNRSFINTTFDWTFREFGSEVTILFPKAPLASITTIAYFDSNGSTATVSSTAYYIVQPTNQPGLIEHKTSWPAVKNRPDGVKIRFVSGYGSTQSAVPDSLRHAVRLLAGHWFENREDEGTVTGKLKTGVDALLNSYSVGTYI